MTLVGDKLTYNAAFVYLTTNRTFYIVNEESGTVLELITGSNKVDHVAQQAENKRQEWTAALASNEGGTIAVTLTNAFSTNAVLSVGDPVLYTTALLPSTGVGADAQQWAFLPISGTWRSTNVGQFMIASMSKFPQVLSTIETSVILTTSASAGGLKEQWSLILAS